MLAKKKWGQHFITDKQLLQKIVALAEIEGHNVLEIGPGKGALTQFLVKKAKKVLAYEIDKDLTSFLEPLSSLHDNLKICYQDYLTVEDDEITKYFKGEPITLVSNLPYNITAPVMTKFLDAHYFTKAVLMVQKELANRILAHPKTKDYGSFGVMIQSHAVCKKLLDVKRHLFHPSPLVDSTLILLQQTTHYCKEYNEFVQMIFANKRKTLQNNLLNNVHLNPVFVKEVIQSLSLKPNCRAEELAIYQIRDLFNLCQKFLNIPTQN